MRVAVIANEFFDSSTGRMGGFGWATRQLAKLFSDSSLGIDVLFFSTLPNAPTEVHGRPLISRNYATDWFRLKRLKIDLFLTIDYRDNYKYFMKVLPQVPVLVWARDPKTPEDWARIATVRVPGHGDAQPRGLEYIDTLGAKSVHDAHLRSKVPMCFAVTSPFLRPKIEQTYGVVSDYIPVLPNIYDLPQNPISKTTAPTIVFLGRLDAQKRPWVYFELAKRCPEYQFIVLGQAHFQGQGAWHPEHIPDNLKLLGHTDGEAKDKALREAWLLVNTSIHEGLAVSFLEALSYEVPIVSTVDPEGLASQFGRYTGEALGDGLEVLPALEAGLRHLVSDSDHRQQLGRNGREWVRDHHSRTLFLDAFDRISRRLGAVRGSSTEIISGIGSYPSPSTHPGSQKQASRVSRL